MLGTTYPLEVCDHIDSGDYEAEQEYVQVNKFISVATFSTTWHCSPESFSVALLRQKADIYFYYRNGDQPGTTGSSSAVPNS